MLPDRPRAEIIELQYLRAIAVLLVVVGHLHQAGVRFLGTDLLGPVGYVGFAGVDVFFVISGFIIHTLYRTATRPGPSYALKRLNRIFPLYWIFTGLSVVGYLVLDDSLSRGMGELDWVASLTLLPTGQPPLLLVGWTLTHELYFYLVYGLVLFLPPRWRRAALGLWALLTVAAMAGLIDTNHPWSALALSGFNLQFIAGIALAEFRERLSAFRWPALITLFIGAGLAMSWTIRHGLDGLAIADIRVLAFITLAIGLVWTVLAWQPRWPKLLAAIGDWSYAIYLGHLLVIGVAARVLAGLLPHGPVSTLILFAGGLVASLALGLIVYRLVETPLLNAGKQLIGRFFGGGPRKTRS
ncbi:acyltransferase [Maricaulis maris]|uniref:acyltransferase family protein n=1 Tax=Maricaulis maris TaxID=74318 RepID=UPI0026F26719|nr:acyltransferase [Maricaulis maris]